MLLAIPGKEVPPPLQNNPHTRYKVISASYAIVSMEQN